jgi:predicted Zn finger-like uncharacterized protein
MILTCPECATRYFVPDGSVGPEGRTVRCANCSNSWRAMPEAEEPLDLDLEQAEVPAAAAAPDDELEEPEPAEVTVADLPGEELPKVFRERVRARQENRRAAASGLVWGLGAAAVVGLLAGVAVSRERVVKAWPKTASVFAAVGLPVNATGLLIEEQRAAMQFAEDGRPALVVSGKITNVRDHVVSAPPLQITLLAAEGRPVATKISQAVNPQVPANASRVFEETVLDPPSSVTEVEVKFALDRNSGKPAAPSRLRKAE